MRNSIETLENLLIQQNELVTLLLQMGQKELLALQKDDTNQLLAILKDQEKISNQLISLETERIALQNQLAKANDLVLDMTLKELIESEISVNRPLQKIGQTLQDNYFKLKELNETNNLLLRQSLGYINKMLSLIKPKGPKLYSQNGQATTSNMVKMNVDKSI
jgi:flagellar biosynthesis/type III secretory pathway chaperone